MCLSVTNIKGLASNDAARIKQVVKVAKHDILCYKRFNVSMSFGGNEILQTPHQYKTWPSDGNLKVKGFSIENHGSNWVDIAQGIHAHLTKAGATRILAHGGNGNVIKAMVIPKGTKYIVGKGQGHIAALEMKLYKKQAVPKLLKVK